MENKPQNKQPTQKEIRDARLKGALRANLQRRKQKARALKVDDSSSVDTAAPQATQEES